MNISASKQLLPLTANAQNTAKKQSEPVKPLRDQHDNLDTAKLKLKKASEEFESFITYYMLKTMRESVSSTDDKKESNPLSGGFGKETFTEMFDMELSKKMATGNSRSLSGMLYKSLERILDVQYTGKKPEPIHFKDPLELHQPKSMPLNMSRTAKISSRSALPAVDNVAHNVGESFHPANLPANSSYLYPETVSAVPAAKKSAATYDRPSALPPHKVTLIDNALPAIVTSTSIKPKPADRPLDEIIEKAAQTHGLDSALIKSVISVESHGNSQAVSPAGAKGLMQLMDSVASDYNVDNAFDPTQNITAGTAHLKQLINQFGDVKLGLAAYNAGPGNVKKYNGIPPFTETEQYVKKVLETYDRFKSGQTDSKVNSGTTDINGE